MELRYVDGHFILPFQVGIHERSAREKIHASQVAHVLNDESARKWIQGLKRLMTFS